MNVTKMLGAFLVSAGIMLMMLGSVIVPVNTPVWGDVEIGGQECKASCADCGTGIVQDDGSTRCLRGTGSNTTNGICQTNGLDCGLCSGGCEWLVDSENLGHCLCKVGSGVPN